MNMVLLCGSRVPQLASIPKTKRQADLRPTHNGSDEISNERNPRQRAGSRSRNSADVLVHRAHILSSFADFKRLIPYSKREKAEGSKSPKGLRYV